MKFIVFSDSHGDVDHMIRAVRLENPALCFFLGDGEYDLTRLQRRFPSLPVNAVRGNCDLRSTLPRALTCAAGGVRIFATHGHLFGVKHDPIYRELCEAALAENADVVLFGHTHQPFRDRTMGMELLNPGSIGPMTRPSYGLILLDGDRVETAVRYLTR
jgi:putative phosphoesterase